MARHPIYDHLEREEKALLDKVPAWRKDPKKAAAEMSEIRKGLVDRYGWNAADLEIIPNHRSVLVARDALRSHALHSENEKLKAQLAEHKKADASSAKTAENRRMKDLKKELADARENPGGKMAPWDIIAKHLGEDTEA